MNIELRADGVRLIGDRVLDGEHMDDGNSAIFAVGTDVILLANLWTVWSRQRRVRDCGHDSETC